MTTRESSDRAKPLKPTEEFNQRLNTLESLFAEIYSKLSTLEKQIAQNTPSSDSAKTNI